ncbi:MAG: hypothetical protein IKC65_06735 [Lentisphaeria bacterium]|nr:hypothetical protein [Lentisphaeria bacterium]
MSDVSDLSDLSDKAGNPHLSQIQSARHNTNPLYSTRGQKMRGDSQGGSMAPLSGLVDAQRHPRYTLFFAKLFFREKKAVDFLGDWVLLLGEAVAGFWKSNKRRRKKS